MLTRKASFRIGGRSRTLLLSMLKKISHKQPKFSKNNFFQNTVDLSCMMKNVFRGEGSTSKFLGHIPFSLAGHSASVYIG